MEISPSTSDLSPMRDLAAQLLAYSVSRFLSNVVLAGGGINSLGFYYDFVLEQPLTPPLLELIEVELRTLIKEEREIRLISMMRENAQSLFEHQGQPLLEELAAQEDLNIIDLFQLDNFYSLCPPVSFTSTLDAGHIKLLNFESITRWIGSEEVSVTRICGTSQRSFKDLKVFLKSYDQFLKKKDHRKLGPQLNLFSFSESMGSLGAIWHPKGMQLRQTIQQWINQQIPWNQQFISTPAVVRQEFLLESSASRDARFQDDRALAPFIFEEEEYQLIPSVLAQHVDYLKKVASTQLEFPFCMTELSTVYHAIPESGQWGLLSACSYLSDWSTICCLPDQVLPELISSLHFIEQIIRIFGFEAQWVLVASQDKSSKIRKEWEAIEILKEAVKLSALFYPFLVQSKESEEWSEGPHLELQLKDVIGREWKMASLGIVTHLSECKKLTSSALDKSSSLVVLTRQILGSMDRMVALLIERCEGVLPLWLAPEQVRVLAIGSDNHTYAREIRQRLQSKGLRAGLDLRNAKLGERVHEAEKENISYLVLVGDQERTKGKISVRSAEKPDYKQIVEIETFLDKLYQECLSPMIKKTQGLTGESE